MRVMTFAERWSQLSITQQGQIPTVLTGSFLSMAISSETSPYSLKLVAEYFHTPMTHGRELAALLF